MVSAADKPLWPVGDVGNTDVLVPCVVPLDSRYDIRLMAGCDLVAAQKLTCICNVSSGVTRATQPPPVHVQTDKHVEIKAAAKTLVRID